ncbi:peptidase S8/S53 domain-containing protein [Phakopsora pachyrhizi]|uniref:Peptidase S8/S53 domain-containing protein n=1 Tax=Phakopsora pachyrhizi TaxID=170000 RepID=A0AAV0AQ24_PHAPC|nr:peptidase S8/S53 domain-containing protein [Phakopsora pachyrhizi]CAH7671260.1 peptidase S8/S53 domain-containing protein [Phakopsora pachyrhizi]
MQNHLTKHNVPYTNMKLLDAAPALFTGLSLSLHSSKQEKLLRSASFVKEIYSVFKIARPIFATAPRVYDSLVDGPADVFGVHAQAGISKLHDAGFKCRNIKIAVIDSGFDCQHPAFGGGFGEGFRVQSGYDFVGDDYNGDNGYQPKNDPCASCAFHGTHVLGVLAAGKNDLGFLGVCPEANISAYRVFGCKEGTTDELIATGLLRAFQDGADIISLSVGSPRGWERGSFASVVASRIAKKRPIIVSAGNSGEEGMFYTTSPATGRNVLSVGSVQSSSLVSYYFTTTSQPAKKLYYYANLGMPPGKFPVFTFYKFGNGTDDACNKLPVKFPNLSKFVVVIRRSEIPTCKLPNQVDNLLEKGATQIIWSNNDSVEQYAPFEITKGVAIGMVTQNVGKFLLRESNKDPSGFKITIQEDLPASQVLSSDAGKVSPFSIYGPMFDLSTPQPAVLGVGGNVLSTYPVSQGSYAVASGTSVSAPQVAGIAALIMDVRGKNISASEIRSRIVSSANPISNYSGSSILESACHQGAGLVNAWCAATSNTIVSAYSLSLNDSSNFQGNQQITIQNNANQTILYQMEHLPAGTALTFTDNLNLPNPWPVPLTNQSCEVSFSVKKFSLGAGESKRVRVIFYPPKGLDEKNVPVYSGFIYFKADTDCESHTVSYYGVGAVLNQRKTFDYGFGYKEDYQLPALLSLKTSLPAEEEQTFTMVEQDIPAIEYRLAFGTPLLLFHLVPGDSIIENRTSNESALYQKNNALLQQSQESPRSFAPFPGKLSDQYKGIKLIESLSSYDLLPKFLPRHTQTESGLMNFNGTLFDLSSDNYLISPSRRITSGRYKILVRSLHNSGNPAKDEDYEDWLSPAFKIIANPSKYKNLTQSELENSIFKQL